MWASETKTYVGLRDEDLRTKNALEMKASEMKV
jgi:hypothetical protein